MRSHRDVDLIGSPYQSHLTVVKDSRLPIQGSYYSGAQYYESILLDINISELIFVFILIQLHAMRIKRTG